MKKTIKKAGLCFLVLSLMLLPAVTRAATIGMIPANTTVHVGDTFNINFTASGKGTPNYTVQINASFDPDIVSFSRWQWNGGGNLIPLKTSGYNVLDNATGSIVQTTGYTEGFSGIVNLADATFVAKKPGTAIIHINPESFAYDETSTNTYVQGSNTYAYIEVLPAVKKPVKETPAKVVEVTPAPVPVPEPEVITQVIPKTVTVQVPVPAPEDSQLFSLNNLIFLIVGFILGLLLLKLFEHITPDVD